MISDSLLNQSKSRDFEKFNDSFAQEYLHKGSLLQAPLHFEKPGRKMLANQKGNKTSIDLQMDEIFQSPKLQKRSINNISQILAIRGNTKSPSYENGSSLGRAREKDDGSSSGKSFIQRIVGNLSFQRKSEIDRNSQLQIENQNSIQDRKSNQNVEISEFQQFMIRYNNHSNKRIKELEAGSTLKGQESLQKSIISLTLKKNTHSSQMKQFSNSNIEDEVALGSYIQQKPHRHSQTGDKSNLSNNGSECQIARGRTIKSPVKSPPLILKIFKKNTLSIKQLKTFRESDSSLDSLRSSHLSEDSNQQIVNILKDIKMQRKYSKMKVKTMNLSDMQRINLSYQRHMQREKYDQRVVMDFRYLSIIQIKLNSQGDWTAYSTPTLANRQLTNTLKRTNNAYGREQIPKTPKKIKQAVDYFVLPFKNVETADNLLMKIMPFSKRSLETVVGTIRVKNSIGFVRMELYNNSGKQLFLMKLKKGQSCLNFCQKQLISLYHITKENIKLKLNLISFVDGTDKENNYISMDTHLKTMQNTNQNKNLTNSFQNHNNQNGPTTPHNNIANSFKSEITQKQKEIVENIQLNPSSFYTIEFPHYFTWQDKLLLTSLFMLYLQLFQNQKDSIIIRRKGEVWQ
eukprot:403352951